MKPEIIIQLVLYHDAAFLEGLMHSVRNQSFTNFRVFAWDNSSDAVAAQKFKELCPAGFVFKSGKNLGFAGGHNALLEYTLREGVPFVLILNTDVELHKDFLWHLHRQLVHFRGVDACGPLIYEGLNGKRTTTVQNFRLFMDFKLGRKRAPDAGKVLNNSKELPVTADVDYLSGVAMMLRTAIFRDLSLWDADLFLYGEERDFFYRFYQQKSLAMVCRKAVCWHFHDWKNGAPSGYQREYYYLKRNKVLFFKKYSLRKGLWRFLLIEILKVPVSLVWTLRKGGLRMFGLYWLGIWHGLKGRNGQVI